MSEDLRTLLGVNVRGRYAREWCFDALQQRPVGGATQPLTHWMNRPTFQQANEIQRHVGR